MICPSTLSSELPRIPCGTVCTMRSNRFSLSSLGKNPHAFYLCDSCRNRRVASTLSIHSGDCVRLCHLSLPSRYPNPVRLNFAALIRRAVSQHSMHHTASLSRVTFVSVNINSGLQVSQRGQCLSINDPCESTIMIALAVSREILWGLLCASTLRQTWRGSEVDRFLPIARTPFGYSFTTSCLNVNLTHTLSNVATCLSLAPSLRNFS